MIRPAVGLSLAVLVIGALATPAFRPTRPPPSPAPAATARSKISSTLRLRRPRRRLDGRRQRQPRANGHADGDATATPTYRPAYPHPATTSTPPQAPPVYARLLRPHRATGPRCQSIRAYAGAPPPSIESRRRPRLHRAPTREPRTRELRARRLVLQVPDRPALRRVRRRRIGRLGLTTLLRFPVDGEEVILHDGYAPRTCRHGSPTTVGSSAATKRIRCHSARFPEMAKHRSYASPPTASLSRRSSARFARSAARRRSRRQSRAARACSRKRGSRSRPQRVATWLPPGERRVRPTSAKSAKSVVPRSPRP